MKLKLLLDHHIPLSKICNQFLKSSSGTISSRTQQELDSVNLDYPWAKEQIKAAENSYQGKDIEKSELFKTTLRFNSNNNGIKKWRYDSQVIAQLKDLSHLVWHQKLINVICCLFILKNINLFLWLKNNKFHQSGRRMPLINRENEKAFCMKFWSILLKNKWKLVQFGKWE
jgi:hypothetical protein